MRLVSCALGVMLPVVAGLMVAAPAVAQEDSMAQQWQDLKSAAGFGPDTPPIDYTERAPLAVPPSNVLPPPGSGQALGVVDTDMAARRKALVDPRRPVPPTDPGASAAGLASRTYLIDPPSGIRDPAAVAAAVTTDTSDGGATPAAHHHHKKRTAAAE